ncbi:hypothetical protein AURANDRAFT_67485 [Aureococcus anophagefferens]|uniref:Uncharacterized protein n=1 Tax=Aureococcus anophagefferens TaxID=44056 RepID=F0YLB4_AURAN|nr:hypothetical protein AURANDRAFT_67485 [Aureococcus anophagefferens]EGB04107.1 hypothetical protein AURANDRAFT_67485 [Aureococcus anophagefferens]|eukprot:XP_009041232.1 hypothetical protein AURANDRAFT_67485 [Aureococcus anophagefferens]
MPREVRNLFSWLGVVSKPECWQEGRISPDGHSVSVSDLWFLAHHYGLVATSLGEVSNVRSRDVITSGQVTILCDVIIKCTGYWKNEGAILDDTGGFQTPFGSSYVEAIAFSVLLWGTAREFLHGTLRLNCHLTASVVQLLGTTVGRDEPLMAAGMDSLTGTHFV